MGIFDSLFGKKKSKNVKKEIIDKKKYTINDNLPPVIENNKGDSNFYKKDFEGLQEYLKEVPNMDRIFNELTYSIRNGLTVESYLKDANILEDPEVSNAALKGFVDIKEFLEGMNAINKNDELNKDILSCQDAIQIIQNEHSSIISNDMDFDEEYFQIEQNIMSIDSYKKEYPFLKEFREKLKTGEIFLEDMDSYIINKYKDLDGDKIMYTISLFEQLEYLLATHLNEWEENNDNNYKGFEDIEQYHSLSQKTIIALRELLTNKVSDLGKVDNDDIVKDGITKNFNKNEKLESDKLLSDKEFVTKITDTATYISRCFSTSITNLSFKYVTKKGISKEFYELLELEKTIINKKNFQEIILKEMNQNPKLTLELNDVLYELSNMDLTEKNYELDENGKIIPEKKIKDEDKGLSPLQIKVKNFFYDKIPVLKEIGFLRYIR